MSVLPSQGIGVRDRSGLGVEQTDQAVWFVADQVMVGGARAVAVTVSVALGTRVPLMLWKVPGLPGLFDRIYTVIADHRRRLPGDEPWCSANPGECEPDT